MLCADVNLLVDLANRGGRRHEAVRAWWEATQQSSESVIVPDFIAASFVRIVTDRRILPRPMTSDEAFDFLDRVLESPRMAMMSGAPGVWTRFRDLTTSLGLAGSDVPDACLAAVALHMDATVVTADRGFRRFPGVRVIDPAA